ncbi:filamin A-interacting protein 1-like isoform X1 [Echinops telfairi]|uniref:Filamin A-interacting protein 1-like isoform X1 n=1 Tax=Echinops telfairi TaxID=9371 RepID=A0ABM0J7S5_ECHTE|nr:filamin A-interacting protein 1-like isoform X1 [Echinops telfairi]
MRSKSSDKAGSPPQQFGRQSKDHSAQGPEGTKHSKQSKGLVSELDAIAPCPMPENSHHVNGHQGQDLSRDDLLFLLSILEGELQARDEVIGVLKAEKMDLALLEAQYGFVTPKKVLEALQRDAFQAKSAPWQEDIYEKPMNELDKVVGKHKESYRRLLEQLLLVENSHQQALVELEEEKRKHREYMKKSDEFISLLEQECERLKKLIVQETGSQEQKDQENEKKVTALKAELTKLKSFALMVVDEQQRQTVQLALQRQKIQELTTSAQQTHAKLAFAEAKAQEEAQKATRREEELQTQASEFRQKQEAIMAKLTNEDSQNRQLRQKLAALSRQIDELEETNRSLRKAEEELQDIKEKISTGEYGNSGPMAEVEELRKRVLEMEGKDEELIKMEEQCRELNKRLEKETSQSKDFKQEVEKLSKKIMALEKLEDAFNKSKDECYSLKCNLEKERTTTKQLFQELEGLKVRIRELEAIESRLEKTEFTLKEDLTKLKTLTVMLVDERKTMSEKLKQTEDKLQVTVSQLQVEESKVTTVTQKLIEETKRALKSKTDVEEKIYSVTKERDDLKNKLQAEAEKGNDLLATVSMLTNRLQALESSERDSLKNKVKQDSGKPTILHQENNKIKELSQEVERLKLKLKAMKAIEDDLMKTEDEYETLERRYASERDKAQFLSEELEHVKLELAKYKLAEKTESSHEQWLFKRLQEEEMKSGHLSREVDVLKEKIHECMATKDLICHLQGDHSILQKKLNQQENRNRDLGREIENLTKELERYRHYSKTLRPNLNGRRISDPQVFSKEVQTEVVDNEPPDYKSLIPLERAVINGQLYEESEDQDEDPTDEEPVLSFKCNSSTPCPVNRKLWIPWMKAKESHPQNGKIQIKPNGNFVQPGDLVLSHTPGQPLHIKVTPDHVQNTATLEITSPTPESPHSYTSTAVIPNCGTPKQRITILQNASITPLRPKTSAEGLATLEQSIPPITTATFARAQTPESCGSVTPERTMSPIQVLAVTGSASSPEQGRSPEPIEISAKHAVFRVTPDSRQASWQFQRSNSNSSSVITTEDNKIHIHLGSPYVQAVANPVRPASPSVLPQDNRTPGLTNGALSKLTSKVTSSITITPTATPLPRQSQMTVSNIYN